MNIFVLVLVCQSFDFTTAKLVQVTYKNVTLKYKNDVLPWAGVIRCTHPESERDGATGLVLIAKKLGICSADEISKLDKVTLRQVAVAIFYKVISLPVYIDVIEYILHPEYVNKTANTIALVMLENNRNYSNFEWVPIAWPNEPYEYAENIYSIQLTDKSQDLEQVIYNLKPINNSECATFYKGEELQHNSVWPTHYRCYVDASSNQTCIYDHGMAVAHNSSGNWTLIGLSIFGPGCSSPSRFIEFFPYIPWIKENLNSSTVETNVTSGRRYWYYRFWYYKKWYRNPPFNEPYEDKDAYILALVTNPAMYYREGWEKHVDNVGGLCEHTSDEVFVYKEEGYISVGDGEWGVGIISVSLYDLHVEYVKCVKVFINCTKRSAVHWSWDRGFGQEDTEDYIKSIPMADGTRGPKVLYIKDNWKQYRNTTTFKIYCKFMFYERAGILSKFYGKRGSIRLDGSAHTTVATTSTTRRPRKYYTHLQHTWGNKLTPHPKK